MRMLSNFIQWRYFIFTINPELGDLENRLVSGIVSSFLLKKCCTFNILYLTKNSLWVDFQELRCMGHSSSAYFLLINYSLTHSVYDSIMHTIIQMHYLKIILQDCQNEEELVGCALNSLQNELTVADFIVNRGNVLLHFKLIDSSMKRNIIFFYLTIVDTWLNRYVGVLILLVLFFLLEAILHSIY